MKRDEAIEIIKNVLPESRYEHTLRVTDTAKMLSKTYNESEAEIELAALLHDYAKHRPKEELKRWILKTNLPKDLLYYHHELWHGPVGSVLIERELGVINHSVQQAIRFHTTGRANMSNIELIVYLADYIEPGRNFPGVENVRALAKRSLHEACFVAAKQTLEYLISKKQSIYPDSLHIYNDLRQYIEPK